MSYVGPGGGLSIAGRLDRAGTLVSLVALPCACWAAVLTIALAAEARLVEMDVSFTVPGESYAYIYPAAPSETVSLAVREQLAAIDGVIPDRIFTFSKVVAISNRALFLVNGASRGWVERFSRPPYLDLTQADIDTYNADPDALIVTDLTMKKTGWHLGDQVIMRSEGGDLHGRVAVVIPAGFARLNKVIMHGERLDEQANATVKGRTTWVNVGVRPERLATATKQIRAAYEAAGDDAWSFDLHHMNAFYVEHFVGHPPATPCRSGQWDRLAALLGLCVLVVVTSVLSLRSPKSSWQAVLACGLGGLAGAVAMLVSFRRAGIAMGGWFFQDVTVTWRCAGLAVGAALALGIVAVLVRAVTGERAA